MKMNGTALSIFANHDKHMQELICSIRLADFFLS